LSRNHWLALTLTPGLGPTRARKLVDRCGGVAKVFRASLTELEAAGLKAESAQAIALGRSLQLAEEELLRAAAAGAQIVTLDDPAYPENLRNIYDPPLLLYVRGDVELLAHPSLAVVGTRHPTPYGLGMALRLSADLAARGLVIISGMARGVDTAAHKGAINGKGKTIAVWGTGVDVVYPRENKKLAEEIIATGGAIISEFAIGTFAAPQNFPIRNRIISGISIGVLVVEAGEYSGTRITARCALEQSRDVYAVPGNVTNKNSWGPNTLIKQGAKLVATWEDIWEDLSSQVTLGLASTQPAVPPSESSNPSNASLFQDANLSPAEKKVFRVLQPDQALQIDEIIDQLEPHLSSSEIFAALFELELAGKIKQLPGKNFVRSF
ncbi:MAG: DNA-processing protein DprA, partial [Terriglobales bacterium]